MRVLITFRVAEGDGGERVHTRHYALEQTDYDILKTEYLAFVNGSASALRGAPYKCIDPDTGQSREMILRFDDILYIEAIVQEASPEHQTGPVKKITGPLQMRIATGSTGEG